MVHKTMISDEAHQITQINFGSTAFNQIEIHFTYFSVLIMGFVCGRINLLL